MNIIGSINHNHKDYQIIFNKKTQIASFKPLPSSGQLKTYYEKYYRNLNNSINAKKECQRLNAIEAFQKGGRLLDVGAGQGHFLSIVQHKNTGRESG